jgi:hypothetical protein
MQSRHREDATLDTNKAPEAVHQLGSDDGQSPFSDILTRKSYYHSEWLLQMFDVCDLIVIFS